MAGRRQRSELDSVIPAEAKGRVCTEIGIGKF
jgi:hypothetical protein